MQDANVTRRALIAAGTLGAAAIGLTGASEAAETGAAPSEGEKANLKVVKGFIASWGAKDFDADKIAQQYLADDSSIRLMETMPAVSGPAAAAAAFKGFMGHGERVQVKFLSTFAKGPIVVTHRIDTETIPGKPDQQFQVVGVFFIKNNKIKEWTDYIVAS